ncbi:transport permease protein [Acrocarpospora phusangensis]|uniref:Transport permease protein n=2 Tax=Acrocarpospora phusangensis TaxID=1070424 RepID=A0A919UT72_9ACTN|nr:transport permease protein [Acrocarpospora phusangensis]
MAFRALAYWLVRYRRTWRGTIVVSVANPILFLLAIGAGLGTLVEGTVEGASYLAFFAPGLLAAATLQNAFVEAGFKVNSALRRERIYSTAAATPLEPGHILAGHLMFITLRLMLSAAAFVVVMALFGLTGSVGVALAVTLAATLTGLAFAAPLAAWAVTVSDFPQLNTVFRFVVMPMYLFSGTFFSVTQLPGPLRAVAYALPLWHGVDLCRALALGTATPGTSLLHAGYLTLCCVAGVLVARVTFRRCLHA